MSEPARAAAVRGLIALNDWQDPDLRRLLHETRDLELERPEVLTRRHVRAAIDAYLEGTLSDQQLEDWAELVQGVEDIEYDLADAELVNRAIFELSTPEINAPVPVTVSRLWEALAENDP